MTCSAGLPQITCLRSAAHNSYNVVLIDCYSVFKSGFACFWAHKSTPSQRFFWKIDYEGVFVLPVDKAENFFCFSWKWNVLFLCPILIFPPMYAILLAIKSWILMFADTVFPDIIWIMLGLFYSLYHQSKSLDFSSVLSAGGHNINAGRVNAAVT